MQSPESSLLFVCKVVNGDFIGRFLLFFLGHMESLTRELARTERS